MGSRKGQPSWETPKVQVPFWRNLEPIGVSLEPSRWDAPQADLL